MFSLRKTNGGFAHAERSLCECSLKAQLFDFFQLKSVENNKQKKRNLTRTTESSLLWRN